MNKKISVFLSLLCFCSVAIAKDKKIESSCKYLPMRSGLIISKPMAGDTLRSTTISVSSDYDTVFSLTTGSVISAMKVSEAANAVYNVVIVQYKTDSFVTYSKLDNLFLKKGDLVKKGQPIANAVHNIASGKNEIGISIYTNSPHEKETKYVMPSSILSFIKRADS